MDQDGGRPAGRSFGWLLRDVRLSARLSQEELAELAGLSPRTIGNLERDRSQRPYQRSVRLLADALQLTGQVRAEFLAAGRGQPALWQSGGEPGGTAVPVSEAPAAVSGAGDVLGGARGWAGVVPRQLPAGVGSFVGRSAELAVLDNLLGRAAEDGGAVVISAIGGTAGVGKTALAVHWAHRVAGLFPGGQLYINLRGYDPGQPVPAADALAVFLRGLGVPAQEIPPDVGERAALYRSLLAERRVLVVLDNAGGAEQVRPLLPGGLGCVTVVTSRDALAGLIARDGARRLELDVLPLPEAAGLLRELIGGPAEADPEGTVALAQLCVRLPLALRVAAELVATRPGAGVAALADELADEQRRLDLLDADGDSRTAVRAVFSWSCQHLDTGPARAFGLLGLHPGEDFDAYTVAALTGSSVEGAHGVLGKLARAHLITPAANGRYGMHDLLRGYARERAAACNGPQAQHAALTRLFDYYLHTAAVATDALYPAERHPRPAQPSSCLPPLTDPNMARAWLDTHRASLAAATGHMARGGWPAHATRLSAILFSYLDAGAHHPEARRIHGHARQAAQILGDTAAEAAALICLGNIDTAQDLHPPAGHLLSQALALSQATGDRPSQASAHLHLGIWSYLQASCRQAASHLRQARALYRQSGDHFGEGRALGFLGRTQLRQGHHQQATTTLQRALTLMRHNGDHDGQGLALSGLAAIDLRQGRHQQALTSQQHALTQFRQAGDRPGQARALADLALISQHDHQQATSYAQQALTLSRDLDDQTAEALALTRIAIISLRHGHYQHASTCLHQALPLYQQTSYRSGEAEALNTLGELHLATSQPGPSKTHYTAALHLTRQLGIKYEQAHAHHGLARTHHALGNPTHAHQHWQHALTLYIQLGCPQPAKSTPQPTLISNHSQP